MKRFPNIGCVSWNFIVVSAFNSIMHHSVTLRPQQAQCPHGELPLLKSRFQLLFICMIKPYKTTLFQGVYGAIPLYYHQLYFL